MATTKANIDNKRKFFTSIEQSKELEKFLQQESADMYYLYWKEDNHLANPDPFVADGTEEREDGLYTYLSSWSLGALLNTIPQEIFDGEYIINITEGSDNRWIITYDHYENRNHSYYGLSSSADNLVDACVKIITRLHELKIL